MPTRILGKLSEASEGHQIARYVINGLLATGAHFAVLTFNLKVAGLSSAGMANFIAAFFGIAVSFLGSRYFVFQHHTESFIRQATKFGGLYASIAVLHGAILHVWTDRLLFDYKYGFLLATALQFVLSYWGNRSVVFKPTIDQCNHDKNLAMRLDVSDVSKISALKYCGTELEIFLHAANWKKYWASVISDFLGNDVLDVGAGIGSTANNLSHRVYRKWVSLEPDSALASRMEELRCQGSVPANIEIRVGTSNILQRDEIFDTILYIDVLEHICDDAAELRTVSKNLALNGYLIIIAPAHNFLFSEFDRNIGHFRRYDRKSLALIKPENCEVVKLMYLDSVGLIASLGNRFVLKSGAPTIAQIWLWDTFMIRLSRAFDRILRYRLGKSIVCILKKTG